MYTLIIISDDAFEIDKFLQSDNPDVVRSALTEWTIKAIGEKELGQGEAEEIKQMSFEELAETYDDFCWGENAIKRVHVLRTANPWSEPKDVETII